MEHVQREWTPAELRRSKTESALVAAAIGGLVGLTIGPVATLLCGAIAALLTYTRYHP